MYGLKLRTLPFFKEKFQVHQKPQPPQHHQIQSSIPRLTEAELLLGDGV